MNREAAVSLHQKDPEPGVVYRLTRMFGPLMASVHTIFPDSIAYFIPASAVVSILFAVWLWIRVSAIRVAPATHTRSENGREYLLEEEQRGEDEVYLRAYASSKITF